MTKRERAVATASRPVPGWLPGVLYATLALALFHEFVFSDGMLFGTDTAALGYFARKFYADFVRAAGELPMWNPRIFGGLPFVDAMHGDIFYPTTLLSFVMPVHRAIGWKLVIHVAAAGAFTYLWLRRLGVSRPAALWGGTAYLLAPVLVSLVYPGHDGRLFVTALTPLLFWATDRAVTDARARDYGVLALAVALLIFTAHMQLAYFAVWGVVGWALYRLFGWRGPAALLPALIALALLRAWPGGLAALALFALLAAGGLAATAWRIPAIRRPILRFGLFAAAGGLGGAVAAVQLVGPACYLGGAPRVLCGATYAYSQRVGKTTEAEAEHGYAYSTSWSLHPEEAFALIVPEFIGANLSTRKGRVDTYWGRNLFKLNHEYAGVLGLFLAPVLFLRRRSGERKGRPEWGTPGQRGGWGGRGGRGGPGDAETSRTREGIFFAALGLLALLYALGATTPAFRVFYALIPGVELFRAPSSIMFLFALAAVTLGALAIDEVRERVGDPSFRRRLERYLLGLVVALGILALLGSLGRALPDLWTGLLYRSVSPDKAAALDSNLGNIRRGLWITLGLGITTAALVLAFARGKMPLLALVGGMLLLSVFDEWRVSARFIATVPPAALFPADAAILHLQEQARARRDPFRVFNYANPDDNLPALFGLEQVHGHHGNEIGRYRSLVEGERLFLNDLRVLKLLNAEFLLAPQPLRAPGLEPVGRGERYVLHRLTGAYPRAFLVDRYEVLPDSAALERLLAPEFDPSRTAVLADELPRSLHPQEGATGSVRWLTHEVNRQALEVEASAPALLVISENYYPAWHARVDGERVEVRRADLTLRAIPVPAGRHQIELAFRSGLFRGSFWLSLVAGALALGLVVGPGLLGRRRSRGIGASVE